jgi:hypothetical protein
MSTETLASSVDEFCRQHRIGRGTYYNLKKIRRGPVEMRVGGRAIISNESAAAWRQRMAEEPIEKGLRPLAEEVARREKLPPAQGDAAPQG